MLSLTAEDILAVNPPITTPGYQKLIAIKKEYRELATPTGMETSSRRRKAGDLFEDQILFQRYMRFQDSIALLAEAGTGKTCKLVGLAEYFRERRDINHVYVMTAGKTQIEDFLRQIVFDCTPSRVYRDRVEGTRDLKARTRAVTKDWYSVYTYNKFVNEFLPLQRRKGNPAAFDEPMTNDQIREKFRGSIFFLDEVQTIKLMPKDAKKDTVIFDTMSRFRALGEAAARQPARRKGEAPKTKKPKDKELADINRIYVYSQIFRILHLAENSKKIVASARIVTNDVFEFVFHMNLILPLPLLLSERRDTERSFMHTILRMAQLDREPYRLHYVDLHNPDVEALTQELKPYLQGRISTFRAFDLGVNQVYPHSTPAQVGDVTMRLKRVVMSPFQKETYLAIMEQSQGTGSEWAEVEETQGKIPRALHQAPLQAAAFVYPPPQPPGMIQGRDFVEYLNTSPHAVGVIGSQKKGEDKLFDRYVKIGTHAKSITRIECNMETPEGRALDLVLRTPGGLYTLSAKIYDIVWGAVHQEGKRYVYTQYTKSGGAYLIALALEYGDPDNPHSPQKLGPGQAGWEMFSPQADANLYTETRVLADLGEEECCPGEAGEILIKAKSLPPYGPTYPYRRYAILSGDNASQHSSIMKVFNSKDNVRGDFVKVIIVSRVGQTGINLFDCLHMDKLEPDFSPSNQYQADQRIFRARAYVYTREEARRRLLMEASSSVSLDVRVDVSVNYLAAVMGPESPPGEEYRVPVGEPGFHYVEEQESEEDYGDLIDAAIYKYARNKDITIGRVIRACKKLSFDCHLNFAHNVRVTDQDTSFDCDYLECPRVELGSADFCADKGPLEDRLDTETYNVYYLDYLIETLISNTLRPYFHLHNHATLEELMDYAEDATLEPIQMVYTLENVIRNRVKLIDRLGYPCYLKASSDIFYLTREITDDMGGYDSLYYTRNTPLILRETLWDIGLRKQINVVGRTWAALRRLPPELLRETLSRMTPFQTTAVLELALKPPSTFQIPDLDLADRIKMIFQGEYVEIPERNRIIHRLYNPFLQRAQHGSGSKYIQVEGVIRVYDGGWRNGTEAEQATYKSIFSRQTTSVLVGLCRKYGYCAFENRNDRDKKFKILQMKGADRVTRGRDISTFEAADIARMSYKMGILWQPLPYEIRLFKAKTIPEMERVLRQDGLGDLIEEIPESQKDQAILHYYAMLKGYETVTTPGQQGRKSTVAKQVAVPKIVEKLRAEGLVFDASGLSSEEIREIEEVVPGVSTAPRPLSPAAPPAPRGGRGRGRPRGSRGTRRG